MNANRWSGHSVAERHAMKVAPRDPAGCDLWTGATDRHGYGQLRVDGSLVYAHRLALALAGVDVPSDRDVDHLCWTPGCVRVEHLRVATHRENGRQQRRHDRSGVRLCGHPWEDERRTGGGCATCHRQRERARREALRT